MKFEAQPVRKEPNSLGAGPLLCSCACVEASPETVVFRLEGYSESFQQSQGLLGLDDLRKLDGLVSLEQVDCRILG